MTLWMSKFENVTSKMIIDSSGSSVNIIERKTFENNKQ